MYLQRLEIQGFKSFAKRTILEFPELARGHKGITSIVGPNGSGKSNIADAIRWVLGEQSLKFLRIKKSEDVIFSGSEQKGRLNMAEVSLYLNNEDKKVPIEFSEIVITRRLYRDGTSEYAINKNEVRLQDVIMLLARAQFGQKSYSVVGQGMIDGIITASVADRKDFFYEATGVRQYQLKKEQSEHKLERTKENLKQVEITLQELEPHLHSLERQVKRLEKREEVESELRLLQGKFYAARWNEICRKRDMQNQLALERDREVAAKENELTRLKNEVSILEQGESRTQVFNALERDYQKIAHERNILGRELASISGKLDVEYHKVGKMNVAWMGKRIEEIKQQTSDLDLRLEKYHEQKLSHEREISEKESTKFELEDAIRNKQIEILNLSEEMKGQARFSDKELKRELELLVHGQKNLIFSLENVRDIEELEAIRRQAHEIMTRLSALYDGTHNAAQAGKPQGLIVAQAELGKLLQDKSVFMDELNTLESNVRVLSEKSGYAEGERSRLAAELGKLEFEVAKASFGKDDKEALAQALRLEKQGYEKKLGSVEKKFNEMKEKIQEFNRTEEDKRQRFIRLEKEARQKQSELSHIVSVQNEIKIEIAKLDVHSEELEREVSEELGDVSVLQTAAASVLPALNMDEIHSQIQRLKHRLDLIGGIDDEAVSEYQEVKERHTFLHDQYQDLVDAMSQLEKVIIELDLQISKQFNAAFEKINKEFARYFNILFEGGNAQLAKVMEEIIEELPAEDIEQITESELMEEERVPKKKNKAEKVFVGIDISASPPGKKVKNIAALSGGEKALTSIALICAIIANNPSPFVVLDEVDAALDERNSEKFAEIVEQLAHKTQFIVITHNRSTMKRSHILYGVTAGPDGISHLLSIKLAEAERIGKR